MFKRIMQSTAAFLATAREKIMFKWIMRTTALIFAIAWATLLNFLFLPAFTFQSEGFWLYILVVMLSTTGLFTVAEFCVNGRVNYSDNQIYGIHRFSLWILGATSIFLLAFLISAVASGKMANALKYHEIIDIAESDSSGFSVMVPAITNEIPSVDVESAKKLGDRQMGNISKTSQFEVNDEYNLIIYQKKQYRISPLEYGGYFKYNHNKNDGIPGYVLVDTMTGESKLVEIEDGIKFSPSAYFSKNLKRHLRRTYPAYMFDKSHFEIDDNGNPYYVVPVLESTIGVFGGKLVSSVLVVNACTGEIIEYSLKEFPEWVDHVYSVKYLMEKVDSVYTYVHGWLNLSKKDVKRTSYFYRQTNSNFFGYTTTDSNFFGYTTFVANGNVVVFSGITSSGSDESNIGFILANTRTGEVTYFPCPGAEESSAQSAAQGLVQDLGYSAGYPIIINVNGVETYFMTLKDNGNLVKKFSLVNVRNYTIAVEADTIEKALIAYRNKLSTSGVVEKAVSEKSGKIVELYSAVIEGTTTFYFKVERDSTLYMSPITLNYEQVTLSVGDNINFTYQEQSRSNVILIDNITF